jgi:hypothetical protein
MAAPRVAVSAGRRPQVLVGAGHCNGDLSHPRRGRAQPCCWRLRAATRLLGDRVTEIVRLGSRWSPERRRHRDSSAPRWSCQLTPRDVTELKAEQQRRRTLDSRLYAFRSSLLVLGPPACADCEGGCDCRRACCTTGSGAARNGPAGRTRAEETTIHKWDPRKWSNGR